MCIRHSFVDVTLIISLSFPQRDGSDNMEASIVLSGESMHETHGSSYIALVRMWLKGPVFVVVRCTGLPAETSGGIREAEGLNGDGVCPGESHPRPLCLRAGGAEPG